MNNSLTQRSVSHIPILLFPITQAQIDGWQAYRCPGTRNIDCLASSMRFLGLINQQTYQYASDVLNFQGIGGFVENNMHLMPGISNFHTIRLFSSINPLTINPELLLYLRQNSGTLCNFLRDGQIGHSVVLARNNTDSLVILDPQQHIIVTGLPNIFGWIQSGSYNGYIHIPYAQEYVQIQGTKNKLESGNEEERSIRPSASASSGLSSDFSVSGSFSHGRDPKIKYIEPKNQTPPPPPPPPIFPTTFESFSHGRNPPPKKNKTFRKGGKQTNKNYITFQRRRSSTKTMKKKRKNRRIKTVSGRTRRT